MFFIIRIQHLTHIDYVRHFITILVLNVSLHQLTSNCAHYWYFSFFIFTSFGIKVSSSFSTAFVMIGTRKFIISSQNLKFNNMLLSKYILLYSVSICTQRQKLGRFIEPTILQRGYFY